MKYSIDKKFVVFNDDTEEVYLRIASIDMLSVSRNPCTLFIRLRGDYTYTATFKSKEERRDFFMKLKEKIH